MHRFSIAFMVLDWRSRSTQRQTEIRTFSKDNVKNGSVVTPSGN